MIIKLVMNYSGKLDEAMKSRIVSLSDSAKELLLKYFNRKGAFYNLDDLLNYLNVSNYEFCCLNDEIRAKKVGAFTFELNN